MPRISAATVAEHHQQRRAALIAAGGALLAEDGLDAVTLGAVGRRAGLARSSVYQYFDSSPALVAAIVEDAFPRATDRLDAAVSRARTPAAEIDRYVRTALELASEPQHRALYALAGADLPSHCRARVAELHDAQYAPLQRAVTDLGVADPELTTQLLAGLIQSGVRAIAAGTPRNRVIRLILNLVQRGIAPA